MASADVTIRMDEATILTLRGFARDLWEARWLALTGVAWNDSIGTPHLADFDVTLGSLHVTSRVRIRGTALEVACRKAEVIHEVGDVGVLRLEIPMIGSRVTVKTEPRS